MSDGFDAVVVGAGPNGLVGAITLAEAGQRVLLLEASERVGGALRTEELTLPGFRHDVGATVLPMTLASEAFRHLALEKDGLRWAFPEIQAAHPLASSSGLVYRSMSSTASSFGVDGAPWRALIGSTAAAGAPLVDTLLSPLNVPRAPLSAVRYGAAGLWPASWVARAFRTPEARATFMGMAAHSVLDLGSLITSGYGMLLAALAHAVGWPVAEGGSESVARALEARFRSLGGSIQTSTPVRSLHDLPPAKTVLLNLTPRQALSVAEDRLPPSYRNRLSKYRYGPGVFKLDWALDGPVPWTDPRVAAAGTVHVCGTAAEVVASEHAMAHGRLSDRPYVLLVQPTVADPTRAPAGKHVLWAYCHVPNGCEVDRTDAIEAQIERFAPGFRSRVLARHAFAPKALEAFDNNLVGGDVGGGAADLRQFVARPALRLKPWATPVQGLYLCSASTPPGGAVHGMGGYRAAKLALKALGA